MVQTNVKDYDKQSCTQTVVCPKNIKRCKTVIHCIQLMLWLWRLNWGLWKIGLSLHLQKCTESWGITCKNGVLYHRGWKILPISVIIKYQLFYGKKFFSYSWYTTFHHSGHPYVPPIAKNLVLQKFQTTCFHSLAIISYGCSEIQFFRVLSSMEDYDGSFSVQAMKNYLNACDILKKQELDLDQQMSTAEAAIIFLNW